jgi:hypothetical protein
MATQEQILRTQRDWTTYAGESVRVEEIGGTLYGFGSELATLRIHRKYGHLDNVNQGFSGNRGLFFFSLTPKFVA